MATWLRRGGKHSGTKIGRTVSALAGKWLPDVDSNHDWLIQSQLSYR